MNDQTQPQPAQETEEKVKVKLSQVIEFNGEPLEVLELRKPKAGDIRLCGLPYDLSGKESLNINAEIIARYIQRLANLPNFVVNQLSPVDFQSCSEEIILFFAPVPKKSTKSSAS